MRGLKPKQAVLGQEIRSGGSREVTRERRGGLERSHCSSGRQSLPASTGDGAAQSAPSWRALLRARSRELWPPSERGRTWCTSMNGRISFPLGRPRGRGLTSEGPTSGSPIEQVGTCCGPRVYAGRRWKSQCALTGGVGSSPRLRTRRWPLVMLGSTSDGNLVASPCSVARLPGGSSPRSRGLVTAARGRGGRGQ